MDVIFSGFAHVIAEYDNLKYRSLFSIHGASEAQEMTLHSFLSHTDHA